MFLEIRGEFVEEGVEVVDRGGGEESREDRVDLGEGLFSNGPGLLGIDVHLSQDVLEELWDLQTLWLLLRNFLLLGLLRSSIKRRRDLRNRRGRRRDLRNRRGRRRDFGLEDRSHQDRVVILTNLLAEGLEVVLRGNHEALVDGLELQVRVLVEGERVEDVGLQSFERSRLIDEERSRVVVEEDDDAGFHFVCCCWWWWCVC